MFLLVNFDFWLVSTDAFQEPPMEHGESSSSGQSGRPDRVCVFLLSLGLANGKLVVWIPGVESQTINPNQQFTLS